MSSKEWILYALLRQINKASKETNDTIIAKALIENRNQLDEMSLEEIADQYYISQPTITRFIKKLGFSNYNAFRNAMNLSIYNNKNRHPNYHYNDDEQIRSEVKREIQETLNGIDTIDMNKLHHITEIIKDYDTIVFLGSELSMSICYKLQLALTSLGKNVYALYTASYQEEILRLIEGKDHILVICISIEGRWIEQFGNIPNLKELPYKILFTIQDHPVDEKYFNYTYQFGKQVDQDIGYNALMYFVLLLERMIMNK